MPDKAILYYICGWSHWSLHVYSLVDDSVKHLTKFNTAHGKSLGKIRNPKPIPKHSKSNIWQISSQHQTKWASSLLYEYTPHHIAMLPGLIHAVSTVTQKETLGGCRTSLRDKIFHSGGKLIVLKQIKIVHNAVSP